MVLRRPTLKHTRGVPNLVVAERVLARMQAAAQASIEDETGEALIGLIVPGTLTNGVPTVYVLDTISPDETAVRQYHTFQQGDDRQDELIWWLQENWQTTRERRQGLFGIGTGKWDVPLRYLGDWHKQPGYMIQPSGGDLITALEWLDDPDNGMDFLIAPIVTLEHPFTVELAGMTTNFLMLPQGDGTALRVDWWYIDRRTRLFQPISPAVYPDDQLPALAPYPWHLTDGARAEAELKALTDDGLFHSITFWNADGSPPLEVCLLMGRVGADSLIIVVTPHDFPQRAPWARLAPLVHMHSGDDMYRVFASAWQASVPIDVPFKWKPTAHLIEYVHAVEAVLAAQRAEAEA
ncbi:MAG: hypothetical protein NZM00_10915, partial [Anaerolinea sp.]|nr:hypothetical protein [Anaerolinea sp.]